MADFDQRARELDIVRATEFDKSRNPETRPEHNLVRATAEQQDFWIVTDYKFFQHATLDGAEQERGRLGGCFPAKEFRVHRCKRKLQSRPSDDFVSRLQNELRQAKAKLRRLTCDEPEGTTWHIGGCV